jgi:hypothetical protein
MGEQWNRAGNRYRDHAAHEKYQVVKIEEWLANILKIK